MRGARGEDPTDPPASADYPFPALPHEPRIQQLADDLAAAGHHPFHAPCGVLRDEANPAYSVCVRCMACDGFPCPLHAKSDAEVLGVRPALEHPNVTLLTGAHVVRLNTDPQGTSVTEVVVERDGSQETYSGDVVVVSAGAANSAKLLLASANDRHPNGLANGSDQVGRNYMFHYSQAVLALSKEPNPTRFQKTLGLNDFYFGSDDFEFPMGNIQMVGKSQAEMYKGEKPIETKLAPMFSLQRGRDARRRLLALDRGPADAGQPRDARGGRQRQAELHRQQPGVGQAPVPPAQVDARAPRDAPRPPDPAERLPEDDDPGGRLRAPGRHHCGSGATRPPRSSTRTARPTSSTTSTWSTRASSRASGR